MQEPQTFFISTAGSLTSAVKEAQHQELLRQPLLYFFCLTTIITGLSSSFNFDAIYFSLPSFKNLLPFSKSKVFSTVSIN